MAEKTANATTRSDAPRGRQQRSSRRDERRNKRDRDDAPKEFEEVVINIDRVARVVKGGRRFRFKALVVVGNRKDKVGVGVAKGQDVQTAISKATDVAKKNLHADGGAAREEVAHHLPGDIYREGRDALNQIGRASCRERV